MENIPAGHHREGASCCSYRYYMTIGGIKSNEPGEEYKMEENETMVIILKTLNDINGRVQNIESKVQGIESRVQNIESKVQGIEITLENETNRNINLIAEGHLNLDRKLDEALKTLQPNTMYHLKVNHLDGEVKKIKQVVGIR